MNIDLNHTDFLLWREPNKTAFQLFVLDKKNGANSKRIFLAPFVGKLQEYFVADEFELSEIQVNGLNFPVAETVLNENTTDQNQHINFVAEAVDALHAPAFHKVVLSRTKVVETQPQIAQWLTKLAATYPQSCAFVFHTKAAGTWMGATPEVLLKRDKNDVFAHSLAGTRLAAENGQWGEKEIEEQQIVTDEILANFTDFGVQQISAEAPKTTSAGPVAHLFSKISGKIAEEKQAIALAKLLHPTPAVGGLPKAKAVKYILENELYNREFYSGFFGIETKHNARFYVNLRSMQLFKNGVVLYAGGGITAQSNPAAEWEETERKLQTLLQIIQE